LCIEQFKKQRRTFVDMTLVHNCIGQKRANSRWMSGLTHVQKTMLFV
jgi:hypothetical protein